MTSTNRTIVAGRISQCLAAVALTACLAMGAAVANAQPQRDWDIDAFDKCMADMEPMPQYSSKDEHNAYVQFCCQLSGGDVRYSPSEHWAECVAPPLVENVPGEPSQTQTPPVLDPGQPVSTSRTLVGWPPAESVRAP